MNNAKLSVGSFLQMCRKNKRQIPLLCAFLLLVFATGVVAENVQPYAYTNPYKATVYGTPQKQRYQFTGFKAPFKEASLVAVDRNIPEVFDYSSRMYYMTAMQQKEAPLVFLIAGTGGQYDSEKNKFLGDLFYEAGFHVVALSSPTHINFLISMSEHGIAGYVPYDTADLYRVMTVIKGGLEQKHQISDYLVSGYSLGGLHSAFLSHMDEEKKQIGISRALMVNPPVSLFDSVMRLDSYLTKENLKEDTVRHEIERFVEAFSSLYLSTYSSGFDDDFLYELSKTANYSDNDLKSLVGISFRMSSASMVFTSDVLLKAGYIVPTSVDLDSSSSLLPYGRISFEISFENYANEFLLPYIRFKNPDTNEKKALFRSSLYSIESYLRDSDKVYVVGTEDDPILDANEVDFLKRTLAERSFFFKTGGHCGNMMYAPFAKKLQEVIAK